MPVSAIIGAEQSVLEALRDSVSVDEADLAASINTLISAIKREQEELQAADLKCRRKMRASLGAQVAKVSNQLESVRTAVATEAGQRVSTQDAHLTALAHRAGVLPATGDLADLVNPRSEETPQIQWGGQLLLDIRALEPGIQAILERLDQITLAIRALSSRSFEPPVPTDAGAITSEPPVAPSGRATLEDWDPPGVLPSG